MSVGKEIEKLHAWVKLTSTQQRRLKNLKIEWDQPQQSKVDWKESKLSDTTISIGKYIEKFQTSMRLTSTQQSRSKSSKTGQDYHQRNKVYWKVWKFSENNIIAAK